MVHSRDMMHEVRAEPLDHRTRPAGLETGEACQRTSNPPQLQVCSTCYGSATAAPSGSHLPWEGYPLMRNPVVGAPCPGPSDAVDMGGGYGYQIELKSHSMLCAVQYAALHKDTAEH